MDMADGQPSSNPLDLICKGEEQYVYLPGKMILSSVMKELGATNETSVRIESSGGGYRCVMQLDVSGITYIMQNPVRVSTIEGEVCGNQNDAESACVQKALQYIRSVQRINIKDYSTRVVESVEDKDVGDNVYYAFRAVRKIIDNWIQSICFSDAVATKLQNKVDWGRNAGMESEAAKIYIDLGRSMDEIVKCYKNKVYNARTRLSEYEAKQREETEKANAVCSQYRSKGYLHNVSLPQKDVLSFVLDYLGAGQATYINEKGEGGSVNAEVHFFVPYLKGVKFVGTLKIHGNGLSSVRAEEHAAYKALRFIEKNYNVRVVDLNYSERLEATQQHKNLVAMLGNLVAMADELHKGWQKMLECMGELADSHYFNPTTMYNGPDALEKIEAFNFCKVKTTEVKSECNKYYSACEKELSDMKWLRAKMSED